jgi:hypothetical protein
VCRFLADHAPDAGFDVPASITRRNASSMMV